MKQIKLFCVAALLVAMFPGAVSSRGLSRPPGFLPLAQAKPLSSMPAKAPAPGKKWVRRIFKGAETSGWIQVWDKPIIPKTGPAATAPRGSEIVGDHWHWPGDYMTVLHGERWGRAGRLGTWKVPVRKVP